MIRVPSFFLFIIDVVIDSLIILRESKERAMNIVSALETSSVLNDMNNERTLNERDKDFPRNDGAFPMVLPPLKQTTLTNAL